MVNFMLKNSLFKQTTILKRIDKQASTLSKDYDYQYQKIKEETLDAYPYETAVIILQKVIDQFIEADQKQKDVNQVIGKHRAIFIKGIKKEKDVEALSKEQLLKDYDDLNRDMIASCMGTFLFLIFIHNFFFETYLVNFSIDAIVGVLGFILMIKTYHDKVSLMKAYKIKNIWYIFDLFVLLITLMIKIGTPTNLDITLPLLLIYYLLSKKQIKPIFYTVQKS